MRRRRGKGNYGNIRSKRTEMKEGDSGSETGEKEEGRMTGKDELESMIA